MKKSSLLPQKYYLYSFPFQINHLILKILFCILQMIYRRPACAIGIADQLFFACFSDWPSIYLVVCPKALLYFSTACFAPFCTPSPFCNSLLHSLCSIELFVQSPCYTQLLLPSIQYIFVSLPHCTFVLLCSNGICLLLIFTAFPSLLCIICPIALLLLTSLPDQYTFVCLPHCTLYALMQALITTFGVFVFYHVGPKA